MIDTGKEKDRFMEEFKKEVGQDASSFKGKPKEFSAEMSKEGRAELRGAFRAAVKEYHDRPKTDAENEQGLAALFDMAGQ